MLLLHRLFKKKVTYSQIHKGNLVKLANLAKLSLK